MLYWAIKFTNSVIIYFTITNYRIWEFIFSSKKIVEIQTKPRQCFFQLVHEVDWQFPALYGAHSLEPWLIGRAEMENTQNREISKSCIFHPEIAHEKNIYPNTWSILCLNEMIWYVNLFQTVTSTLVTQILVRGLVFPSLREGECESFYAERIMHGKSLISTSIIFSSSLNKRDHALHSILR